MKTSKKSFAVTILFLSLFFIYRTSILKGIGQYLINEDPEKHASYSFVLGGNSYDRGMEALDIFNRKLTENIVCTGGNIPTVLAAIDTSLYEAEITTTLLYKNGVPSEKLTALTNSTSTLEEAEEILNYCKINNIDTAHIITSKFHLHRVRNVFEDKFEEANTQLIYLGAPSSSYNEEQWWKSEQGMIMVNNEYMKLVYYFFK